MTVFEQLVEAFHGSGDGLMKAATIKTTLAERYGTNPSSVIPSDYCYNRWNRGIAGHQPLFVRVGSAEYRYLGPDQSFTGLVFWRPKGATADQVAGERVHGVLRLFDLPAPVALTDDLHAEWSVSTVTDRPDDVSDATAREGAPAPRSRPEAIPLSFEQLDRLYEEYMEILTLELGEFGCKPTETRHLIGRLGEFFCARTIRGQLARRVNQAGFDVVGENGRRVSVKTTAQRSGFVSLNANTIALADELMVLRYDDGAFEVVYFGDMAKAIEVARPWKGRFELDVSKARRIGKD